MHSQETKNAYFHFHGDFTGDVIIVSKKRARNQIRIDAQDLKDFMNARVEEQKEADAEAAEEAGE